MKIINKTKWNTKDLKHTFQLSLKEDNKIEGNFNRKLTITINYRKYRKAILEYYKKHNKIIEEKYQYKGWAYYYSGIMRISLPRQNINPVMVSQIFIHELSHCRGYKHKSMGYWLDIDVSFLPSNIKISKLM